MPSGSIWLSNSIALARIAMPGLVAPIGAVIHHPRQARGGVAGDLATLEGAEPDRGRPGRSRSTSGRPCGLPGV